MIKKQLACLLLSFVFSLQVLPVMAAPQINTDARVSYDTSGTVTVNISASQAVGFIIRWTALTVMVVKVTSHWQRESN